MPESMSDTALIVALSAVAALAILATGGCAILGRRIGRLRAAATRQAEVGAELERSRRETHQFVAGVSHELRTPLTAIIGFTELLRDGRAGTVNRHQHDYLGIVRSSADHLLGLIDDVLDTAGVQCGHIRLDPEPLSPQAVAQECVVPLRHLASERGVALEFCAQENGIALLDPSRLRQVIVNLLSNAIKFTGAGGRVTLTIGRRDERLFITVSDTGIGIDEDDRERIFEPFVRLGGIERQGSGLGLALTRDIVNAQGGAIGVESRRGAGSTFSVWLPWVAVEEAPAHSETGWQQAVAAMGLFGVTPGVEEPTPTPYPERDPLAAGSRPRRFRPSDGRRGPGAADVASRPASARALRP